jgi:hypothetical protein
MAGTYKMSEIKINKMTDRKQNDYYNMKIADVKIKWLIHNL